MNYTQFSFIALETLFLMSKGDVDNKVSFDALLGRFNIDSGKKFWIDNLRNEWVGNDFAHFFAGDDQNEFVTITESGISEARDYIDNKYKSPYAGGFVGGNSEMEDSDLPGLARGGRSAKVQQPTIDSTTWTGLPRSGVLSEEARQKLLAAIRVADDALTHAKASNEEISQARAYIIAIHALAEAPEPPADLIWQIVQRANAIAGVAALFVAILALYK